MPKLEWFDDEEDFLAYEQGIDQTLRSEKSISRSVTLGGHCVICGQPTEFIVSTGAFFSGRPNLREGLRCARCKLTARQRLLMHAFITGVSPEAGQEGIVMERFSRPYRMIKALYPKTKGSEYLAGERIGGKSYLWWPPGRWYRARITRHENLCDLSYADGTQGFLVHSDILEHISDTEKALSESARVLKPGGVTIFTVPFFTALRNSVQRGYVDDSGKRIDIEPPEYHGDGLNSQGVYTFYNFGWSLFDQMSRIFRKVEIGALHNPDYGFVYADSMPSPWNMLPIVFRATK